MAKTKNYTPAELQQLAWLNRQKAKVCNEIALEFEKALKPRIERVGKMMIEFGLVPAEYSIIEGYFEWNIEHPKRFYMSFYRPKNVSFEDHKKEVIPAEWILCNDDSFFEELHTRAEIAKEKANARQATRDLQNKIREIEKASQEKIQKLKENVSK